MIQADGLVVNIIELQKRFELLVAWIFEAKAKLFIQNDENYSQKLLKTRTDDDIILASLDAARLEEVILDLVTQAKKTLVVPLIKFLVVNDLLRENLFKFVYWVAFFIPFGDGKGVLVALLLWSSRVYGLRLKLYKEPISLTK